MAGVIDTTHTFANNEVITSTLMNNIIDQTFFTSDALANSTLALTANKIKVATSGITSNEMGVDSVTANAIADGVIANAKISATAAISLSKLANEALPTGITVATANLVDANVTTAKIADAAITAPKLDGAQTGTAPAYAIRSWVNFNGKTAASADVSGNFSRSGTTITLTVSSHGLIAGNLIFIDFVSGTVAPDGMYVVASVIDANNFTVTSAAAASGSGTAVLKRKSIRGGGNISCVSAAAANPVIPPTSSISPAGGYYVVNFWSPMPSGTSYAILGTCSENGEFSTGSGNDILSGSPYNSAAAIILTTAVGTTPTDCLYTSVSIIN